MTDHSGLFLSTLLLLFALSVCRAWYRPTTIRSAEVRERLDTWRAALGTAPFLAVHVALPFCLGITGIAAAVIPWTPVVAQARVLLLLCTGLYLSGLSLAKFRELRRTRSGARVLRSCVGVGLVALLLGLYLGAAL
jgi:hypothetical protein